MCEPQVGYLGPTRIASRIRIGAEMTKNNVSLENSPSYAIRAVCLNGRASSHSCLSLRQISGAACFAAVQCVLSPALCEPAESSALAPGLFGNVVGLVEEFTD